MAENPDGSEVNTSQDMVAQGASNIVAGLFGGIPVGASIGQTAMNISNGAKTRMSGIFTGLWMLVIVLFLAPLVEQIPIAAITVLIVLSGFSSVNFKDLQSILHGDWISIISFVVTLLGVVFLDIPTAVLIGVIVSSLMVFFHSANNAVVSRIMISDDDKLIEQEVPETMFEGEIMVLQITGNLYFTGAKALEDDLPDIGDVKNPVVILNLRGTNQMGSTLIDVIDRYSDALYDNGGKLYLTGLDLQQFELLESSHKLDRGIDIEVYKETPIIGEATIQAYKEAKKWLKDKQIQEFKEMKEEIDQALAEKDQETD